jgi:hypothetical protein
MQGARLFDGLNYDDRLAMCETALSHVSYEPFGFFGVAVDEIDN